MNFQQMLLEYSSDKKIWRSIIFDVDIDDFSKSIRDIYEAKTLKKVVSFSSQYDIMLVQLLDGSYHRPTPRQKLLAICKTMQDENGEGLVFPEQEESVLPENVYVAAYSDDEVDDVEMMTMRRAKEKCIYLNLANAIANEIDHKRRPTNFRARTYKYIPQQFDWLD